MFLKKDLLLPHLMLFSVLIVTLSFHLDTTQCRPNPQFKGVRLEHLIPVLGATGAALLAANNVHNGDTGLSLRPQVGLQFNTETRQLEPQIGANLQIGNGPLSPTFGVGGQLSNGQIRPSLNSGVTAGNGFLSPGVNSGVSFGQNGNGQFHQVDPSVGGSVSIGSIGLPFGK